MAGGAAGILGGMVLKEVLGGDSEDGSDMDGLVDGVTNMMSSGDNGGLLDGVFSGGNETDGVSGGDNSLQQLMDSSNSQYLDPSNQAGDPTSLYDQYQQYQQQQQPQQQQQSGNNFMQTAQQTVDDIHQHYQQHQQHQQQQQEQQQQEQYPQQAPSSSGGFVASYIQSSSSNAVPAGQYQAGYQGGVPAASGQAQQNPHWQTPPGAQYTPQQNTLSGYQGAPNPYHVGAPQGQTTTHGQTHLHPQAQIHQSGQMAQPHQPGQSYQPGQMAAHGQAHLHPQAQIHQPGQIAQPQQQYQPYHPGQSGQSRPQYDPLLERQVPQNQGVNINKTHVKKFAKGALIAGRLVAKFHGVNI
jgi:hypothetical protein